MCQFEDERKKRDLEYWNENLGYGFTKKHKILKFTIFAEEHDKKSQK